MILYINSDNTVSIPLRECRIRETNTEYFGIRFENCLTGQSHYYSNLTDISEFPFEYNQFEISVGNITTGEYRFFAYELSAPGESYSGLTPCKVGRTVFLGENEVVVFTDEEEKSNVVFDED